MHRLLLYRDPLHPRPNRQASRANRPTALYRDLFFPWRRFLVALFAEGRGRRRGRGLGLFLLGLLLFAVAVLFAVRHLSLPDPVGFGSPSAIRGRCGSGPLFAAVL